MLLPQLAIALYKRMTPMEPARIIADAFNANGFTECSIVQGQVTPGSY